MAATGTPTPNIGLRIPQGTDPASVDDINYNSNLLDTKLGAVGNTSVQDQITALNSKVTHTYFSGDSLVTPLDTSSMFKSFETVGKNVCITFRGQDRSHTENEVFMQIPTGYRPGGDRYFPIVINPNGVAVGIMKANGDVQVWSSNPPYGRIVCMLSYMAD